MKIEFEKTLGSRKFGKQGDLFPVQAVAFAPDSQRVAFCDDDRVIWLYGENGEYHLHFPTKPVEKEFGKNSYIVTGISFSPDSTKLAVAQSDQVVYVYRLPKDRDKSELAVVFKYVQSAPVIAVTWMPRGNLVFGLQDGIVRLATSSKRSDTVLETANQLIGLYSKSFPNWRSFQPVLRGMCATWENDLGRVCSSSSGCTITLSDSFQGSVLLSAHIDGAIYTYAADKEGPVHTARKLVVASKSIACLAFSGEFILIGSSDGSITIYNIAGKLLQEVFPDENSGSNPALTAAVAAPNGRYAVFGAFNRLKVLSYVPRKGIWTEMAPIVIENLYVVPSLAWNSDGTKLAVSSLFGAVDIFTCAVKKQQSNTRYETTFVTPDQVLIRDIQSGTKVTFRTESGQPLDKVSFLRDQPVAVATTADHLILINVKTDQTIEVNWEWLPEALKPLFHVEETGCVVSYNGKLSVLEFGRDEILFSVTTPNFYARLFSLRITSLTKRFACLPNRKLLRVVNLENQEVVASFRHDVDIDWLTFNSDASFVVARDLRYGLLLFNGSTKEKRVLSQRATFVDLVEGTDVLVAQEGSSIRTWMNIGEGKSAMIEKSIPITGKVTEVSRTKGQTVVQTVDSNTGETQSHVLDDDVGQFENAVGKGQLNRAFDFLVGSGDFTVNEANWKTLTAKALDSHDFALAEKIFETLKDSRAKDVRDLVTRTSNLQKERGRSMDDVLGHYTIRATIERLKGDLNGAEKMLLSQRDHKRAIIMFSNAEQYVRALKVAEEFEPTLVPDLIAKYQGQLAKEGKTFQLAEVLAYSGAMKEAATLYLGAAFQPLEVYRLLIAYPTMIDTKEGRKLHERVLPLMQESGLDEMVGRLLELTDEVDGALRALRAANCYEHAIEYARRKKPEEVVPLERECAQYLVKIRKWQDAISHFVEANLNTEALDAAIHCHDFRKAAQILSVVDDEKIIQEYGHRLALHFQDRDELTEAVEIYKKIGRPKEAIQMYLTRGKIEEAHQYAESIIKSDEIKDIFRKEAEKMVRARRYNDAERLFLQTGDVDAAVKMYGDIEQFPKMISLVKKYKDERTLEETHVKVAQAYRKAGSFRQAELYFTKAERHKDTVQMYVEEEKWAEAYRVASEKVKEMVDDILYMWIMQVGLREGIPLLRSLGATKAFVTMALRAGEYDNAVTVATEAAPDLLPEIYQERGAALAQAGRHLEAEREFLVAGHADQAVQMYIDAGKWPEAIRLTTAHYPEELPQVLLSYAMLLAEAEQYAEAEEQLLKINRADYAITMYKEKGMYDEALRLARQYRPGDLQTIEADLGRAGTAQPRTAKPSDQLVKQAREREERSDYAGAVQLYLRYINDAPLSDSAMLLRVCNRIREVSLSFLTEDEARSSVSLVAQKYLQLNRPNLAATAFAEINEDGKALDAFMDSGSWDEARALVSRQANSDLSRSLDQRYRDFLRTQGKVEQLASVDASAAAEMYARNSEWDKALKVMLETRNVKLLAKYLYEYGLILLKGGEDVKVVEMMANYNAPVTEGTLGLYRHVFCAFVAKSYPNVNDGFRTWVSLRDLMYTVCENLLKGGVEVSIGITAEFDKYLQIAIYYAAHYALICEEATKEMGWMVLLSLLRYSDVINPDKAFYDAGRAAQQLNWTGTADSVMNTYLDWRECIIRQNIGLVDYSQFAEADIPTNVAIPVEHSVSEAEYEAVKTWILKSALNQNLKFELQKDERGLFVISLSGGRYPPCVLTGLPVISNGIKLGTAGRYARKVDLNRFLQAIRSTRSDKLEDVRRFLVKWCGASTELNYAFV